MAGLTLLDWALDGLLALLLLWLAWRTLATPALFRAVLLFIAFGLVLALVWARLYAVDVALAEMAIGAGVTGALLLAALVRLEPPIGRGREGARAGDPEQDKHG
jgi:energy-converting hydrogenase B subunit D